MKVLSNKEAKEWLSERHIHVDARGRLSFETEDKVTELFLSPPVSREAITDLPVNLVGILHTGSPWLLWLKDFSIWSDDTEELGWKVIDTFATVAHQPGLGADSSALVFEPDEMVLLKTSVLVPVLFMWDAYLVNGDGSVFIYLNHDDHSFIATRRPAIAEEIQQSQLKHWIQSVR